MFVMLRKSAQQTGQADRQKIIQRRSKNINMREKSETDKEKQRQITHR